MRLGEVTVTTMTVPVHVVAATEAERLTALGTVHTFNLPVDAPK